ncbi:ABC transporter ATP-binding protein [Paenibacillus sp. MBLB4367]|uniref:ABC transporter ATP-binding protein n=1 Tax=Paenibacillus sp. MBLB4367 TaxID=3384767 RepID=UPI0039080F32
MSERNSGLARGKGDPADLSAALGVPGRRRTDEVSKGKAQNTAAALTRVWRYIRRQRTGLFAVIVLVAAGTAMSLAGPYLIGMAIDRYVIPHDKEGLLSLSIVLAAVYAGASVVTWLQAYVMAGVSGRTVRDMRTDLFAHLQLLPLRFFDKRTHGELISRTTNDIENVSNTLNQSLPQLIASMLMLTGSLIMMALLNGWLTGIALFTIPLVTLLTKEIAKRTKRHFQAQQQHLGELNGITEETISGQKVVKLFNREDKAAEQFQEINARLTAVGTRAQILSGMMGPIMNMMNHVSFIVLAVAGGWMAYRGYTSIGVIVSFLAYSRQFSGPINDLANQYNMIQSGMAGAERVFETLDEATEYAGDGEAVQPGPVKGEVAFKSVTFRYGEAPTLRNVSFIAEPGDVVALVGPTGAGKTTIINLLTRFYEIESGSITIDGQDIRTWDKSGLRRMLGIVLQDAYLFSGTIRENISYGRLDATEEEMREAARLAKADDFIMKLPQGYDTPLAAEGGNVSHGQRQLITIARAILADPSILILDEATSSIDTRTEMHIQQAMAALMKGRTSFVIAHRLSTIRDANQILVLHGGEIIERGTHEQLLAAGGFYSGLHAKQFE